MVNYDTFPLKTFFEISKDESKVKKHNLSPEDWAHLKEEWTVRNPTDEYIQVIEAHRKVIVEQLKLKRDIALFRFILNYKKDPKEIYKELGLSYSDDPEIRVKNLTINISKSKQKLKIFTAQRDRLEKEIKDNPANYEEVKTNINEVLASLELHGFSISDYDTFTLGRYDGVTTVIKKKEKSGK